MSCLTDSIVDPPHLRIPEKAACKRQACVNNPLMQLKHLRVDSLFSLFSWTTKNEAGDHLHDDSVDAVSHSVDSRRNPKRGPSPPLRVPSPPPRAPSPTPYLGGLSKLPPLLMRSLGGPKDSDVDRGLKKVDTNIDTGRDENNWLNAPSCVGVDAESEKVEVKLKSRHLDVGDSVDRRGSVESLSYDVDVQVSVTNASETSGKDWEAHEAESILSEIYDLGDDCICLMHPCICNLDENSYPEPAHASDGKMQPRLPRKQVSARIRQREKETLELIQQMQSSPVDRKELEGTSTDLHYHSSSMHAGLEGEASERKVKLSERVISKTRFSPYTHGGTDVDPDSAEAPEGIKSLSNRGALLQNDQRGHAVDPVSRLSHASASVDEGLPGLSSMYSSAVDAGDTVEFSKAFASASSAVDGGITGEQFGETCFDADIPFPARSFTVDVNVASRVSSQNVIAAAGQTASRTSTLGSDHLREPVLAELVGSAENVADAGHVSAADNDVTDQANQMGTQMPVEVPSDVVLMEQQDTPRSPDVMYDEGMGDSLERVSRQTSFPSLPRMLDAFGFGADRVRSTNVDDAVAEDNGSESMYAQMQHLNNERELRIPGFLPDDAVDGSASGTDQFSDGGSYGMAVDGCPGRPSPPRRCRSDPDMAGSKTDPPCYPSSYPRRSSKIPRRVLKPGEKTSEQELPSQQEQKQQRSPQPNRRELKPRQQQERGQQNTDSARPPSEEGQDAANMCKSPASRGSRSPMSPTVAEERNRKLSELKLSREHVNTVITSENRSKPYVPQVITFYTHKDSKVATTIPPPCPIRKTPPVKTPDLPIWNSSTLIEKTKKYSRPQPLHYKRQDSCHGTASMQSDCANKEDLRMLQEEEDCMEKVSAYLDMSQSEGTQNPNVIRVTSSARSNCSRSSKPPAYPHKTPFRPAGVCVDKRRQVPASNTERSLPDLRVPGKVEIPVVYPSMRSDSSASNDNGKCTCPPSNSTSKSHEEGSVADGDLELDTKPLYSPGPESYHYPAYTAAVSETANNTQVPTADDSNNSNNNSNVVRSPTLSGDELIHSWFGDNMVYCCEHQQYQVPSSYCHCALVHVPRSSLKYSSSCRPLGTLRSERSSKQLFCKVNLTQYAFTPASSHASFQPQMPARSIAEVTDPAALHLPVVDLTSRFRPMDNKACWSPSSHN